MHPKNQIKNYLNRYVEFNDKEIDEFYSHLKQQSFKKKSYLLEEGKTCRHNYFILKGLVRSFYIDEKGNEQIVQFGIENWWVTNIESFLCAIPSELSIQALEDTDVLSISKKDLDLLYISIPKLERCFRIITENMLIAIQRMNAYYLKISGEEKYNSVVEKLPDFLQRVPQYMLASYLGMTPEHLSAIRKKK